MAAFPRYLQYLDGQLKKNEDAQVKAGYERSKTREVVWTKTARELLLK
jgi:hypothetical protein